MLNAIPPQPPAAAVSREEELADLRRNVLTSMAQVVAKAKRERRAGSRLFQLKQTVQKGLDPCTACDKRAPDEGQPCPSGDDAASA